MNKYHQQKIRQQSGLLGSICGIFLIGLPAIVLQTPTAYAIPRMEADKPLSQVNPNPTDSNTSPSNPSDTSTSPLNPRPSIFNEPPYNRSRRTSPTDSNAAPQTRPLPGSGVTPTMPDDQRSPSNLPTIGPTPGGVTPTVPDDQRSPSNLPTTQPAPGSGIQPPLPEELQDPSALVTPLNGKINIKLTNATNAVVTYQVIGDTGQRRLTGDSDVTLQNIETPVTVTFVREDGGLLKVSPQATSAGLLEIMLDEATNLNEGQGTIRVQEGGQVFIN